MYNATRYPATFDNLNLTRKRAWAFIDDHYDSENFEQIHYALMDVTCSLVAANFAQLRSCLREDVMLVMWFDSSEHGESLVHLCRDCATDTDVLSFGCDIWRRRISPGHLRSCAGILPRDRAGVVFGARADLRGREPHHKTLAHRGHDPPARKIRDRYDLRH